MAAHRGGLVGGAEHRVHPAGVRVAGNPAGDPPGLGVAAMHARRNASWTCCGGARPTNIAVARGSFGYMQADGLFPVEGLAVLFQAYVPRPYPQWAATGEFVPYLSVLDAMFNIGPEETLKLIVAGTSRWRSWDEMLAPGETYEVSKEEPFQG